MTRPRTKLLMYKKKIPPNIIKDYVILSVEKQENS